MLKKHERFTREQFTALLSQKGVVTVYNGLGTLKFVKGPKRLAVVTSGKHEKRATVRNKLRRRAYSLFRAASADISGVLYASKQSYAFDYEKVSQLLNELLSKTSK